MNLKKYELLDIKLRDPNNYFALLIISLFSISFLSVLINNSPKFLDMYEIYFSSKSN